MLNTIKTLLTTICMVAASLAIAADAPACTECHAADEFAQMDAADIAAAVRDSSIPPHKKLADISDAELQEIARSLAGS